MQANLFDPPKPKERFERNRAATPATPLDAAIARAEYDVVHGRHRNKGQGRRPPRGVACRGPPA